VALSRSTVLDQTTEKTSSMFSGGGLVGGGQHHGIELLKIKSALAMPFKRSRYSWVQKVQARRTAEEKVD